MKRYVVNSRGRAMEKNEEEVSDLLQQGFVEITRSQFEERKYFPEYDRGPQNQVKTIPNKKTTHQVQSKKQIERTEFTTTVV